MTTPPQEVIERAERAALNSPCKKSRRGVVTFSRLAQTHGGQVKTTLKIIGEGWNGPPSPPFARGGASPIQCDGSKDCRRDCAKRCVHAEARALRSGTDWHRRIYKPLEMLHVEIGTDGKVIACDGPSCWQCSKEILDSGLIVGMWLFERTFLSDHDDGSPSFVATEGEPKWRFYTANEFHLATLSACAIQP